MTKDDLKPGMWYLISAPTAGTLVIKQGNVQVPVAYQAGQTPFYALSNEVEYGAGAVINGPFAKAPTLGLGGGGGPVYTLGSDNTYKFVVSETTAELTRPATATDWFHVRMPMHLHGNNLQHGAGASIFAQGSMLASMSARGFYVEDGGTRVFELDSDSTGAVYMAIGGSTIALGADGVAPATVLHSHAVYHITADAATGFNFSALSLAAPLAGGLTTVRLLVSVTGTGSAPQVWADPLTGEGLAAHWLDESNPSVPPTLEAGKLHHVVLESDGGRLTAHVAYSRDLT